METNLVKERIHQVIAASKRAMEEFEFYVAGKDPKKLRRPDVEKVLQAMEEVRRLIHVPFPTDPHKKKKRESLLQAVRAKKMRRQIRPVQKIHESSEKMWRWAVLWLVNDGVGLSLPVPWKERSLKAWWSWLKSLNPYKNEAKLEKLKDQAYESFEDAIHILWDSIKTKKRPKYDKKRDNAKVKAVLAIDPLMKIQDLAEDLVRSDGYIQSLDAWQDHMEDLKDLRMKKEPQAIQLSEKMLESVHNVEKDEVLNKLTAEADGHSEGVPFRGTGKGPRIKHQY